MIVTHKMQIALTRTRGLSQAHACALCMVFLLMSETCQNEQEESDLMFQVAASSYAATLVKQARDWKFSRDSMS